MVIQMEEVKTNIKRAYSEVLFIINNFEPDLYRKIPSKFINFLYNNRNKDSIINIDLSRSINEQNILTETRVLLAIIYRDYICSKEKKIELIKEDEKYFEEENQLLYDIFKKNHQNKNNDLQMDEDKSLIIVKDNFFSKIKKIINKLLGK